MKRTILATFTISLLYISNAAAGFGCFPKTDMKIPEVRFKNNKSFTAGTAIVRTQSTFQQITSDFKKYWDPILQKKYGKSLSFEIDWSNAEVDAVTTRDDDNNPIIKITGGIARHPELSDNGLLIILCHELGHHFGGAPKNFRGRSTRRSWSSAEGQADYFATNKCFKRMELDGAIYPIAKSIKMENCTDKKCEPVAMAALSVGNVFASLKPYWKRPKVNTKSPIKVDRTQYKHPEPQCRFDTYMAGSKCSIDLDSDFDDADHKIGACIQTDEAQAARPRCWFSPQEY